MATNNKINMPFMKMHGLGNDFVVIDSRVHSFEMTSKLAIAIGNRRTGIGFDQLAVITKGSGDAHLSFWNSDGSTCGACGNATRCIARYLMTDLGRDSLHLTTTRGDLYARDVGDGLTSVNMGHPLLDWADVPLLHQMGTLELPMDGTPTATSMGNTHCTFIVADAEAVNLEEFGPPHEHHRLFPERTNVQVASITGKDRIRMRVWERGAGITMASGSSACATVVTAVRRGLTGRNVQVDLDGGTLHIDWRDDGVWMTGPTCHVCDGVLTSEFLGRI